MRDTRRQDTTRQRKWRGVSALAAAVAATFAIAYVLAAGTVGYAEGDTPQPLERQDRGATVSGLAPMPALPSEVGP